jgi:prepilin-type N-terminal cleavage/methylation domain-containing protein
MHVQDHRRRPRTCSVRDAGFSLVEVLVVIVVLGVLASIVVFSVRGTSEQSSVTGCDVEQRAVASAIEVYQAQHGEPPADLASLVPGFLSQLPAAGTATGGGSYDPADGRFDPNLC